MDVLVVGAGEMGRWVATVLSPVTDELAFTDADPAVADAAAETAEHDARTVPVGGEESFTLVCLAVPMSVAVDAVGAQASRAERALVDVTGVMGPVVAAMRDHAPNRERLSLHPLFAPDNAPGTVAAVTDAPGPATDRVLAAIEAAGNDPFETTAEEHDAAMESVQAAAHAAVLAYALATDEVREEFHTPVSSALSELVGTVTGGTPRVYREIQATFDGAEAVADAATRIAAADGDEFESLYERARRRSGAPTADGSFVSQGAADGEPTTAADDRTETARSADSTADDG